MDLSEELRKYKELLDEGIITQEDFDNKKRELLDASIKEKNKGNSSLASIKSLKDNITKRATGGANWNSEKESDTSDTDDETTLISASTNDSEDITKEHDQVAETTSSSMPVHRTKKKIPIIPIVVIGIVVLVLTAVLFFGSGKIYKNKQFNASYEKVYSEFEKSAHKNLGSNITFDANSDIGEHGYTFKYKDVIGYLIIDEEDDKASMVTVAASYDSFYSSREDDAVDVLATLFLTCDPSIKRADIESEIASNMEELKKNASGYGDKQSMNIFEFKGIPYIFSYSYYYSSDTDVFQLAIYEPKGE